ncbi:sialate:O-sulfotransferase 1-like [Glandiceps talaboti]
MAVKAFVEWLCSYPDILYVAYPAGFRGKYADYRKGNNVVVKTHNCNNNEFSSAILLIRNPYNALIAEYRRRLVGHQSQYPLRNITGEKWEDYVAREIRHWHELPKCWLSQKRWRILVVYYEDLKKDTMSNVERMMSFLNLTFTAERRQCIEENMEGNNHRPPAITSAGTRFDPFTTRLRELVDDYIQKTNQFLKEHGHSRIRRASKIS